MKKLLFILCACIPLLGAAKDKKDNTDPKYLTGAVTLRDGKVTFDHRIAAPGLPKDAVFRQMKAWASGRFTPQGGLHSMVAYTDSVAGDIAVAGEEYLVFSSTALSLDRTRIYYQLLMHAADGQCDLSLTRIRYWYDEARDGGEKYTAEEWITDKMALNKKGTKLAPICGKFRRETIDLKDRIFAEADAALRQSAPAGQTIPAIPLQPATPVAPTSKLMPVAADRLPADLASRFAGGRITLTAESGETVELTAADWNGFGKMFGSDVAYILLDKGRVAAGALMEQSPAYSVSFYAPGDAQPAVVIRCQKAMAQPMTADALKNLSPAADTSKAYVLYIGRVSETLMRQ